MRANKCIHASTSKSLEYCIVRLQRVEKELFYTSIVIERDKGDILENIFYFVLGGVLCEKLEKLGVPGVAKSMVSCATAEQDASG